MNAVRKYRFLFWVLAFLGIVFVSAATSYFVYTSGLLTRENPVRSVRPGMALQKELSLSPDQTVKVEQINNSYKETTGSVITAIRDKKSALLEELSKDDTDTLRLAIIADELNLEQKKLQQANINQFMALKKVCNPEQTRKLSRIYSTLYGCQGKGDGIGPGNGQGMGRRHRHGQDKQNKVSE